MKIHTVSQLQDALDADFAWRLKEIADLRAAARSHAVSDRTMIRAGIALLYAHCEGFIKYAATKYVEFVDLQGMTYGQIRSCFSVFGLRRHITEMIAAKKPSVRIAAMDFIYRSSDTPTKLKAKGAIDTESNLKAEVFDNILCAIGLAPDQYEARYNLMDESLLARRNRIAHGEYLDLDADGWRNLSEEVIRLMRDFKTDIQNAASTGAYLRPVHNAHEVPGF